MEMVEHKRGLRGFFHYGSDENGGKVSGYSLDGHVRLLDLFPKADQRFFRLAILDMDHLAIHQVYHNRLVHMPFGYSELVNADIFQPAEVRIPVMTGKVGLLNVLHRIPAHMQEGSHIFDDAYAREFDHKAAEPVGVSAFARNEIKMFLTDGSTILAFNTLDF